jgi:hypothetical protein
MSADRINDIPDAFRAPEAPWLHSLRAASGKLTSPKQAFLTPHRLLHGGRLHLAWLFPMRNKDMNGVARRVRATSTTSDKVELVSASE